MASALQLSGVDELLAALTRLAPDLTAEAIALEGQLAGDAAEAVRLAYPVLTGQLRASVHVQRQPSNSPARAFTEITVDAPYAHFVEFGTARTAPSPAFVPITRRARETFVRAVVDRVRAGGLTVGGTIG